MSKELPCISIFISSPGDVAEERELTRKVIERLQGEFSGLVELNPIYWEHEPLLATQTFQEQIIRPSETDIVITILWSRLGTRLPSQFTKPDGSHYASGTEYEFEDAIESFKEHGTPDLLIYRKTADPKVSLKDKKVLLDKIKQKEALDNFFDRWFHDKTEGTLIAAFHPFANSANFEEIFESHLSKLIRMRLPDSAVSEKVSTIKPVWKEGSPFRGLDVFKFEHSPIFFGRTKAISEIIDALRIQSASEKAFVLVLGKSGGGKSSLVRAGVLPMITQPGVIEGVGLWRRAIMKPGDSSGDLFDNLAASLLHQDALPELSADGTDFRELAQILRDTPKAAVPLIKGGLSQAASAKAKSEQLSKQPTARLVLVVDQMEEMFSLESITPNDRRIFIEALDALSRSGRVWVIATLRSDFYPRTTELEGLVALKEGSGQYDLLSPTTAEIGQMIRQPAQAAGLYFEEDSSTNERLDDVLRDASAKNPSALPLLEFTLEELYKQRTDDGMLTYGAYKNLGGVEGALSQRAEEVFSRLEPKVQQAMDVELHSLISIGVDDGERISRKYAPVEMVTSTPQTKAFVEAFVEARLFTTDLAADGSATVNIAHEALLRHWPRLQEWVEKNREDLRIHARVNVAATRWENENRSREFLLSAGKQISEAEDLVKSKSIELTEAEKTFVSASIAKRKRIWWIKRAIAGVLVLLTIVAIGTAYLAQQQRDRAETEAKTSEQVSEFLVGLFEVSDPSKALGDTITAREILNKGAEKIEKELSEQPKIKIMMLNTIGSVYFNLGLYEEASTLEESALKISNRIYGEEHVITINILITLTRILIEKGKYKEAEPLIRKNLLLTRKVLGNEHIYTADCLNILAELLLEKGDYAEAEPLYRETLELSRKLLGNEHEDVIRRMNNLAVVLHRTGNFDDALPLFQEALAMNRIKWGSIHPQVARNLNNLGMLLQEMGNYDEAEIYLLEALSIQKKMFGLDHPSIATLLGNIGLVSYYNNDYFKADSLFLEALVIRRKLQGDEHPSVASTLNYRARLKLKMGDYDGAEPLFREILEIRQKALSQDNWRTARSMNGLGGCLTKLNRFEEAESLLLESYSLLKEKRDANDKYTIEALNNIIELYNDWNKPEKVKEYEALISDTTDVLH